MKYTADLKKHLQNARNEVEKLESIEDENFHPNQIDTGRSIIDYRINNGNLLDIQIMDALAEVLGNPKINHLEFLQLIEKMAKTA